MKVSWNIKKIKCDGCVQTIAETLLLIDGLTNVTVDLDTKSVAFETESQTEADRARAALKKAGFPPDA